MSYSTSEKTVILNLFQDISRFDALYNDGILKQVQDDEYRENALS